MKRKLPLMINVRKWFIGFGGERQELASFDLLMIRDESAANSLFFRSPSDTPTFGIS